MKTSPWKKLLVTDIEGAALKQLKKKLWFMIVGSVVWWAAVVIVVTRYNLDGRILFLMILPFTWGFSYYAMVENSIRAEFWLIFAQSRGWSYQGSGDPSAEAGVMFRQGDDQKMHHVIRGLLDNRPLRVFEFEFTKGYGKRSVTYYYTVFEYKFLGQFPHLYLNQTKNGYGISLGKTLSLPAEFEKYFKLSVPQKYEIEALQIFTPDVLARLLDTRLPHDIEIVDQELLIFMHGKINGLIELEREFERALTLVKLFAPILDTFKFSKIGTMAHTLSQ